MFNPIKPRIFNLILVRNFSYTRLYMPVKQLKKLQCVPLKPSYSQTCHSFITCRSISLSSSHFTPDQNIDLKEPEILKPLGGDEVHSDLSSLELPSGLEEYASEAAASLSEGVGQTLESVGLGGYSPVGLLQQLLEFTHSTTGLPWFGTIVLCTLAFRILMFPFIIENQKRSIAMSNHLPGLQKLQIKMMVAKKLGEKDTVQAVALEMSDYLEKHDISLMKTLKPALVQAPMFCCFFLALRGMAAAPLESLKTGGTLWFTDLTIPDPYFLLPVLTSTTLFICLEMGADGIKTSQVPGMKYMMRAMPLVMLPAIISFPSAILCYWGTNNVISLGQVILLRHPAVREYFKIPKQNPTSGAPFLNPFDQTSFTNAMKEAMDNMHISAQAKERQESEKAIAKRAVAASSGSTTPLPSTPTLESKRSLSISTEDSKDKAP